MRHHRDFIGLVLAILAALLGMSMAATEVDSFHSPIVTPFATEFEPHEHAHSRAYIKSLIWPQKNPIDDPGLYPISITSTGTDTFAIQYETNQLNLSSRIEEWTPATQRHNCFAIYHEGHTADNQRPADGLQTVEFLLGQGCHTYYVDMPLRGINAADQTAGLAAHNDFYAFPWPRNYRQLSVYLEPVAHLVGHIYDQSHSEPYIIMVGRSGGGWTTLWYAALDNRIDAAVIVAGFWPQSMRLRPTLDDGKIKPGDYEQAVTSIYDFVSYEDLVNLLVGRKVVAFYSTYDPCCFNTPANDPFVTWLGERIDVYVDPAWTGHGLSPAQYAELDDWLKWRRVVIPVVVK